MEMTGGISVSKKRSVEKANEILSGASDVTGGWRSGKSGSISQHLLRALCKKLWVIISG